MSDEKELDGAEKLEQKLDLLDRKGKILYKYAKKWVLGLVAIITAVSLYFGIDPREAVGLKATVRDYKKYDLNEEKIAHLKEDGYHAEDTSALFVEHYVELDSTLVYASDSLEEAASDGTDYIVPEQQEQMQVEHDQIELGHNPKLSMSHLSIFKKHKKVNQPKEIIHAYYDIVDGDTLYIDVFNDGTDSVYYAH